MKGENGSVENIFLSQLEMNKGTTKRLQHELSEWKTKKKK